MRKPKTLELCLAILVACCLTVPVQAAQIGEILACYACSNTGDPLIDAALAANPGVAGDGILFAFRNTSGTAITGGIFSLSGTSPADSFTLPTIAANGEFILMPGITNDSKAHPSNGLFAHTGNAMDTSDGAGNVSDSSIFMFTGMWMSLGVVSDTAGTNPANGTFTPGDPGLFKPYRDNPSAGRTSFVGDGPNGDGGCNNCYFGVVAFLDVPTMNMVPEPSTMLLFGSALIALGIVRKAKKSN